MFLASHSFMFFLWRVHLICYETPLKSYEVAMQHCEMAMNHTPMTL